jgi:formyltetrahydrofolate-dependent phosphoribosylglycinamide formyltransferase
MLRVAVFASGRGTDLQSILDAKARGDLPLAEIALVLSNVPDAPALERARKVAVEALVVPSKGVPRDEHEARVAEEVNSRGIGLVVLAGYMRVLSPRFFSLCAVPVINIHPALLPLFGGKGMHGEKVHEAVLASGMRHSGCTVHLVTPEVDAGPIVLQKTVPVMPSDDAASLAARVLEAEHRVLPLAVRLFSEGRVRLRDGKAEIDRYAEVVRELELV